MPKSKTAPEVLEHRYKMKGGPTVVTTWHDTRKAANARIAEPTVATFRKVFHEPKSPLGEFRAVTWE